jgi:hypothetical protein
MGIHLKKNSVTVKKEIACYSETTEQTLHPVSRVKNIICAANIVEN